MIKNQGKLMKKYPDLVTKMADHKAVVRIKEINNNECELTVEPISTTKNLELSNQGRFNIIPHSSLYNKFSTIPSNPIHFVIEKTECVEIEKELKTDYLQKRQNQDKVLNDYDDDFVQALENDFSRTGLGDNFKESPTNTICYDKLNSDDQILLEETYHIQSTETLTNKQLTAYNNFITSPLEKKMEHFQKLIEKKQGSDYALVMQKIKDDLDLD